MFSLSEEELEKLSRHRVIRYPRNFEERRLLDIENSREFREKCRLSVKAFEYLFAAEGQQINLVQLELTHVVYKRIQVTIVW